MAHFAKLNNENVVTDVIVVSNDALFGLEFPASESAGIAFLNGLFGEANWKQTSYNANFRGRYAGIGFVYDAVTDTFVEPDPPVVNSDNSEPVPTA